MRTLFMSLIVSSLFATVAAAAGNAPSKVEAATDVLAVQGKHTDVAANDDVEEIEDLEVVEDLSTVAVSSSTGSAKFSPLEFVGHFHAAAVHFPVAWTLLLLLLELWRRWAKRELPRSMLLLLWALVALSFVPAAMTGLIVASHGIYSHSAEALAEAMEHRNIMLTAMAVILTALGFAVSARPGAPLWRDRVYMGLLVVGFSILGFGAHHGGVLVHGASYFPF